MSKILWACLAGFLLSATANAQDNNNKKEEPETIEGNGKLVTRDVHVSSFDALQASGVYELKLSQGNSESVKIEADENLQDLFDVHNEGNKLVIGMKKLENKNLRIKDKMTVYVTFRKLKDLSLKTVGNVKSDEQLNFDDLTLNNKSVGNISLKLNADKLELTNKSVGHVRLEGKAQNAVFRNSGVGSLDASNFVVQTMDIENAGIGSARVNAEKNLKVKEGMTGRVHNQGAAQPRRIRRVQI